MAANTLLAASLFPPFSLQLQLELHWYVIGRWVAQLFYHVNSSGFLLLLLEWGSATQAIIQKHLEPPRPPMDTRQSNTFNQLETKKMMV
jgi:hypothetical protein